MDHPHSLANTADGTDSIGDRKAENVAFTPGPWRVHMNGLSGYGDNGRTFTVVTAEKGFGLIISELPRSFRLLDTDDATSDEFIEEEANAHLIAAAPALYEALERAVAEMDGITEHTICDMQWSTLDAMRAALRLARGEKK